MISIICPTYEMNGVGVEMFVRCLNSIENQTFKDYEIVVSDNSEDEKILNLCKKYANIKYIYNPLKGMSANTNNAIKNANGELIKILYQDDWLNDTSIQTIIDNFGREDNWLVTACSNNLNPRYSSGINTLGSPSVLTIRNKDPLLFNENLKYYLDLEYYRRMYERYGEPKIIKEVGVNMGLGEWQETNHLTQKELYEDYTRFEAGLRQTN